MATAIITLVVALDGDGSATFMITITALLPIYKRLGMSSLTLAGVVALGAGVMNIIPWGGPLARAMVSLGAESSELFNPYYSSHVSWDWLGSVCIVCIW